MKKVEIAIKEFVEACKKKFGKDLVSIVLFGSYARGKATRYSDIDLLVVAKRLPRKTWERDDLVEVLTREIFDRYGECIQAILVEPKELEVHARWPNPLFYGIFLGYKPLYGNEFMEKIMEIVRRRVKALKPTYVEGGKKWELAKMI